MRHLRAWGWPTSAWGLRARFGMGIEASEVPEVSESGRDEIDPQRIIRLLKRGPVTLRELSNQLDRGEPTIDRILEQMMALGYGIERTEQQLALPPVPQVTSPPPIIRGPATTIRFGIMSDPHFGSLSEQPTGARHWLEEIYNEGVRHVVVAGDWVAGQGVYPGQEHEVYVHTAGEQVEATDARLPRLEGLRYYGIGGNHDYSFYRLMGQDVVRMLADRREDVVHLGYDTADVPLLPGVDARLWHPRGGPAYALSYKGQKYVEQLTQDELMKLILGEKVRPTVRFVIIGHFHRAGAFPMGPIWVIYAGAWEGQTQYAKSKGHVPQIGGWLVECDLHEGALQRIKLEWMQYAELERDYEHYAIPYAGPVEGQKLEPLFSLKGSVTEFSGESLPFLKVG